MVDVEEVSVVISGSQLGSPATMPPAHMPFRAIADDLAARIAAGEYPPGSRLPTYRELAALYSVGQMTITRALQLLRERGLVEGYQGKGVFVASTTLDSPMIKP